MVLPDEISSAAYDGDVDTVRRFLAQHPERVNDVEEPEGHLAMLTVAIRLVVDPETRPRSLELVRLLISCGANVNDVDAPDALAEVLPRPAEGAPAPPIAPGAQTRQGQAVDAATPRPPLRAEPAERDRVARARVLEPPLLTE